MKEKIDYAQLKEELLEKWFSEKKGFGMKRHQFYIFGKKSQINRCLAEMRKDKIIAFGGGHYWCMKEETYKRVKETFINNTHS
jgi:hypothetical protein